MLNEDEINDLKNKLPFWGQLTLIQQNLILNNSKTVHFQKGDHIHNGESDCLGFVFIRQGCIRVYMISEEGREITLYWLEAGDICILSASCVLSTITFDVCIDAENDCDLIQLNTSVFSKITDENIYAELFSYKLATQRFSEVMWTMQQILFISFDKRLAAFLLEESMKNNSPDLSLTHEQIARYLGSAREVVSRMLKYFSREGYVTLSRGGIHIIDEAALKKLVL